MAIRPLDADSVIALVVNAGRYDIDRDIAVLHDPLSSKLIHALGASALQSHWGEGRAPCVMGYVFWGQF